MAFSRGGGTGAPGSNYVGYPALIFWLMAVFYKVDTYQGRFTVLEMWYSHLRAKLPEQYENREEEYKDKIDPMMKEISREIETARTLYDPTFEGMETCNPDEKEFSKVLSGVYMRLDELTAVSKMVDAQRMGPVMAPGADE